MCAFHLDNRIIREPYVKELSRHILVAVPLRYSTFPLTTVPLRFMQLAGFASQGFSAGLDISLPAILPACFPHHRVYDIRQEDVYSG